MSALSEPAPGSLTADRERQLVWFAVVLTAALLVGRLVVIGRFGLFADEAYYWLWSEDLSFGYYDHPPMIALFIWLGTLLFGDGEFGVRVVGAVSVVVDVALVYGIARVLFDSRRVAAWAAILANVTYMATLSVIIVPDHAMLTFWLAGMFGIAKIARDGAGSWWILAGAMFGLAAASKYSTAFMALAVLIWLLLVPTLRRWLLTPWPYLGGLAALAVLSPVILWNIAAGWPSIEMQLSRDTFAAPQFDGPLLFLAGLAVAVSPLVLALALWGFARCLGRDWRRDPVRALLVVTPIPLLAFFAYYSLWESSEPHWISAVAFFAPILAAIPLGRPVADFGRRIAAFLGWAAVAFGAILSVGTYAALADAWLPFSRVVGYTARFHGWEELAGNVAAKVEEEEAAFVVAATYGLTAQLRFYLRGAAIPVYQLGEWERGIFGQPDVSLADAPVLFVHEGPTVAVGERNIERYFGEVAFSGMVSRQVPGGQVVSFATFVGSDPGPLAVPLFARQDR